MKKILLILFTSLSASFSYAQVKSDSPQPINTASERVVPSQGFRFGFLSCDSVLHATKDYTSAKKDLEILKGKYDAEMKRVEEEFNQKYELFLETRQELAPSILQKRQAELQEIIEKNTAFKEESIRLLQQAEKESLEPIRQKVIAAVNQVGKDEGLAFVLNTDNGAFPFIDSACGIDVTELVIRAIK